MLLKTGISRHILLASHERGTSFEIPCAQDLHTRALFLVASSSSGCLHPEELDMSKEMEFTMAWTVVFLTGIRHGETRSRWCLRSDSSVILGAKKCGFSKANGKVAPLASREHLSKQVVFSRTKCMPDVAPTSDGTPDQSLREVIVTIPLGCVSIDCTVSVISAAHCSVCYPSPSLTWCLSVPVLNNMLITQSSGNVTPFRQLESP